MAIMLPQAKEREKVKNEGQAGILVNHTLSVRSHTGQIDSSHPPTPMSRHTGPLRACSLGR